METANGDQQRQRRDALTSSDAEFVLVIWRDAHADDNGSWLDINEIDDEPYLVHSAGFLLRGVKKNHVSIAQSLGADEGVVDSVLHVPQDMVISITTVKFSKRQRKATKDIKTSAKKDRSTR